MDGTVYSTIDEYFAKRTYDTNGDYVVNDFKLTPSANNVNSSYYDLKVGKRLDIKFTDLMVYSPYVSYYNDIVMKSPYVMIPSIGVNIGITKKFKFNINAGGAWSLGNSTLNYTVTCGTRLMVGQ
jgi:hypothetical protein